MTTRRGQEARSPVRRQRLSPGTPPTPLGPSPAPKHLEHQPKMSKNELFQKRMFLFTVGGNSSLNSL